MIVNAELARSKGVDKKDLWATPPHIFRPLNDEFGFTLDPCAEVTTAKCERFFTPKINGLVQDWSGNTCFVNPPYSRGNIDLWVEKCYLESLKPDTVIVALLPVSTSAIWWHDWIIGKCEMRFVARRIKFVGAKSTAPFSSVIAVFGRQGAASFNQR